ncbi:trypsin-like serine peptidase [Acidisoma sp.]|uniref:trypsin-like serine peptidase n=1 Tax=Acidisoma sp. TaxID=1872115 RepID=UPI003B000E11
MSFSSSAPYNGVVYVTDTIGGENFQGSGVLIAPNLVLTAAHVVYEAGLGTATNVEVTPGYDAGVAPFGSAYALTFSYNSVADYGDEETLSASQDDFALIKLGTSFSGPTIFGLGANYAGGVAYVSGYPASADGALESPAQNIGLLAGYSILQGLALGPGSSGGPVWTPGSGGAPVIDGLVSTSNDGIGYNAQLTTSAVSEIEGWVAQDEAPTPPLTVFNTSTNEAVTAAGSAYGGPVAGLENTYANITPQSLNIVATTPDWFITTGSGNDAITVTSGTNVVNGGAGSNFLTGGNGTDTFYVDATAPDQDIWSTVVNFHKGDAVTLWGVSPETATLSWASDQGASGYTGLTLHAETAGGTSASLTLDDYSQTDLSDGRLAIAYGTNAALGPYMYIAGTG